MNSHLEPQSAELNLPSLRNKPESRRFESVQAVLFDLDGTLADSAPDLAAAANALRSARGLEVLPYSVFRPLASQGARGLIRVALGKHPEDADFIAVRDEFLDTYAASLCVLSHLFDGIPELLQTLESRGLRWGIVTNKFARFTIPFVEAIGLATRAAVVVSGDTTAHSKPHPAPLLHACQEMDIEPSDCIYVGDDLRDIQAGHAAGMRTVAATYGYCENDDPAAWGADALIHAPLELLELLPTI